MKRVIMHNNMVKREKRKKNQQHAHSPITHYAHTYTDYRDYQTKCESLVFFFFLSFGFEIKFTSIVFPGLALFMGDSQFFDIWKNNNNNINIP